MNYYLNVSIACKQEAVGHMKELDKFEDARIREQKVPDAEEKL